MRCPGAHVVRFSLAGAVRLEGALPALTGDLLLDEDLNDDGAADVTIDADASDLNPIEYRRVLDVGAGTAADPNEVAIDGVVLTGGTTGRRAQ